ncbi:MAG: shikimate dehydrogenase [Rhodobacteraceae bacterium]|nr:shikimate dehydrogenase [Paracoccaceae bacterium]
MPKAGVIGWPVKHSKSPIIYRYWLEKNNIRGHYTDIEISPDDFQKCIFQLADDGFVGVNVTIPYKESAIAMADKKTSRASSIGAANMLIFRGGGIIAENTDAEGFIRNLRASAPDWNPARGMVLVLGAGGAARAIIYALVESGASQIFIANRTQFRAKNLAAEFQLSLISWDDINQATAEASMVVNTTSLGMAGQPPLDIELNCPSDALVTDIVYTPVETPLLAQAKAKGLATVDGLGMLLHQAVPGFEAWFGTRPAVTPALREKVLSA